jgi:hypothetical protein
MLCKPLDIAGEKTVTQVWEKRRILLDEVRIILRLGFWLRNADYLQAAKYWSNIREVMIKINGIVTAQINLNWS